MGGPVASRDESPKDGTGADVHRGASCRHQQVQTGSPGGNGSAQAQVQHAREATQRRGMLGWDLNNCDKLEAKVDTLQIESLKSTIQLQKQAMEAAQTEADHRLVQSRMFVERAEREHETILAKEVSKRDQIIGKFFTFQVWRDSQQQFILF